LDRKKNGKGAERSLAGGEKGGKVPLAAKKCKTKIKKEGSGAALERKRNTRHDRSLPVGGEKRQRTRGGGKTT